MRYKTENKHIDEIRSGDYVLHNEEVVTVGRRDIKLSEFMGTTLFGDCYHLGTKPVKKVTILGSERL